MRALSTAETALFGRQTYGVLARVRIADADGNLKDFTNLNGLDWVQSVEWGENYDQPVATAKVVLHRAHWLLSLAPLQDSKLNRNAAGAYARLVDIGRSIKIDASVAAGDGGPASWVNVFDGHILEVDWGSADKNEMTIVARDLGGRVHDTFIETRRIYGTFGGQAVETVMGNIITDNWPGGLYGSAPSLYTPTSPSWLVKKFAQDRESALVAICKLAQQIGWDLRYRWDDGSTSFRLTFYQPSRSSVVPIGGLVRTGGTTVTATVGAHGFHSGDKLSLSPGEANFAAGVKTLTSVTATTFVYSESGSNVSSTTEETFTRINPDRTFTRDKYFAVGQSRYSLEDIRNVVQVVYDDSAVGRPRTTLVRSDSTSVAAYGRRFMEISEAATSNIDSATEAGKMADAALADLKDPRSAITFTTACLYAAQLGDVIEIDKDGVTFDQAIILQVTGLKHSVAGDKHRTEWSGVQVGGVFRDQWMALEARPGISPRQESPGFTERNIARAIRNVGTQAVNVGVTVVVVFDKEIWDHGGYYDNTTGVFTAWKNGVYKIQACVRVSTAAAQNTTVMIRRNGAVIFQAIVPTQGAGVDVLANISPGNVELVVNDTIDVQVKHDAAANQTITASADTLLDIVQVR